MMKNELESSLSSRKGGTIYTEQKQFNHANSEIKYSRNRNISAYTDIKKKVTGSRSMSSFDNEMMCQQCSTSYPQFFNQTHAVICTHQKDKKVHSAAYSPKRSSGSAYRSQTKNSGGADSKEDFNWQLFSICKEVDSLNVPTLT